MNGKKVERLIKLSTMWFLMPLFYKIAWFAFERRYIISRGWFTYFYNQVIDYVDDVNGDVVYGF